MENKKSDGLIIGIIIGVLLGGIVVYFVMVKNSKITQNESNTNNIVEQKNTNVDEKTENTKNDSTEKRITMNELYFDEKARQLFDYINVMGDNCVYPLFKVDEKNPVITYDSLSNDEKFAVAYEKSVFHDLTGNRINIEQHEKYSGYTYMYNIPINDFEYSFLSIFGTKASKTIEYNSKPNDYSPTVVKNGESVDVLYPNRGSCDVSFTPALAYYKSELVGDDIVIYAWSYTQCDYKEDCVDKEGNELLAQLKYKVTFKKDKDNSDNYYWYSTELVK